MDKQSTIQSAGPDRNMVRRVATLARLAVDEQEEQQLESDLGQILTHFNSLSDLDTDAVEPVYHPQALENSLREDVVQPSIEREAFMNLTSRHKDGCLMVPRTVE